MAAAALIATSSAAEDDPIRIGSVLPLTGIGAASGVSATIGIEMAIDDINAEGGILGRKVVYVPADDQGDPTHSVAAVRRLSENENVDAIVGPAFSQSALAVAPVATEADVVYITLAGSLDLTPKVAPLHFSMQASADGQGVAMVDHAAEAGAKKIAVLVDNAANSKTMAARIRSRAAERGLEIVGEQEFMVGSTDMLPQLLSLRGSEPEMLLVSGIADTDAGHVLRNIDELGWDVPIVGSLVIGTAYASISKISGPEIFERVVALDIRSFSYCSGEPEGESGVARLMARLKQRIGQEQFDRVSRAVVLYTYDAVHVAKAAIEGAGTTKGAELARWIEANAGKIPAVLGELKASPESHFLSGGPEANAMVEKLGSKRGDGLRKRVGC